jgi:hypothetical protein
LVLWKGDGGSGRGRCGVSILIYSGGDGEWSERLQQVIRERFQDRPIETYSGVQELSERLLLPLYDLDAAVLLIPSIVDLEGLLSFRSILSSLALIMVLPDSSSCTVSVAHKLCPRFLTYSQDDFGDVAVVLGKIVERADRLRSGPCRPVILAVNS